MNGTGPALKIRAPKQLLVEGRTPELFFQAWIDAIGFKSQIDVQRFNSVTELTPFLKVITGRSEFREIVVSVGVIRDAEDKPATSAFESVCASLKVVGLPWPDAIGSFSEGTPRTGVFVLPDCQQPGMLETLCWSAPQTDPQIAPQLRCVNSYLECLRKANARIRNEAKAKVWTFLAGLGQFEPQVGRAGQAKIWDWASPALVPLSSFLKAL